MGKKCVATVLSVLLLAGVISAAAFTDTANHWAETDIEKFQYLDLVNGKGDDLFDPDAGIARGEFVVILNRAFPQALETEACAAWPYSDIESEDWFYEDVMRATTAGLAQGVGDARFQPDALITREDSVVLLARYMNACGYVLSGGDQKAYTDEGLIHGYAKEAVNGLTSAYVIKGYTDGTFRPQNTITRAEGVVMASRAYQLINPQIPTLDDYYWKLDGSTVTRPLSMGIMEQQMGVSSSIANGIITHNKTDAAIKSVIDGAKDLALVTYPSQENLQYAKEQGVELVIVPIVNEAFVFMVNEDNPVDCLTTQQVKDIYSGTITNWSEVGGEDAPILALQRNADSGSQSGMLEFMGETEIKVPFEDAEVVGAMDMLIERVVEEKYAIGYSYYYYTNTMNLSYAKLIGIDGVAPSNETIENQSYGVVTQYYAVFRATEPWDSFARTVTEYILSPQGQAAAETAGYVKLSDGQIMSLPVPLEGETPTGEALPFSLEEAKNKLGTSWYMQKLAQGMVSQVYSSGSPSVLVNWADDDVLIKEVVDGDKDIVLTGALSDAMIAYAKQQSVELEVVEVARDRLVFITGKENPVNNLAAEKLRDIFIEKITNWLQLGGENKEIFIYGYNTTGSEDIDEATRILFEFLGISRMYGNDLILEPSFFGPASYTYRSNELGYGLYATRYAYIYGKFLSVDGYAIEDEKYPAQVTYYAVFRASEEEDSFARRFLACILSDEGQALAESLDYLRAN